MVTLNLYSTEGFKEALQDRIAHMDNEEKETELFDFWFDWIKQNMNNEEVIRFIDTGEL